MLPGMGFGQSVCDINVLQNIFLYDIQGLTRVFQAISIGDSILRDEQLWVFPNRWQSRVLTLQGSLCWKAKEVVSELDLLTNQLYQVHTT